VRELFDKPKNGLGAVRLQLSLSMHVGGAGPPSAREYPHQTTMR
jgi:hypothetical protein